MPSVSTSWRGGAEPDVAETDEQNATHRKSGPSSSRHPPCERGTGLLPRKRARPPMIPATPSTSITRRKAFTPAVYRRQPRARDGARRERGYRRVGRDVAAIHARAGRPSARRSAPRRSGSPPRSSPGGASSSSSPASASSVSAERPSAAAIEVSTRTDGACSPRSIWLRYGFDTRRARRDRATTTSRVVAAIG